MLHSFDAELARRYGVQEAIVIYYLQYWIERNERNGQNFVDGEYWTFNSAKKMSELLPYFSQKQIQRILSRLIGQGILKTGCYNRLHSDRTLWYTFTEFGKSILPQREMDFPETSDGFPAGGQALPVITPDKTPIDKQGARSRKPAKRFSPPTREEVASYCRERGNGVDARRFVDHYTANGWRVGKNPMKDWKAAVRTWEKNDAAKPARPRDDTLDGIL